MNDDQLNPQTSQVSTEDIDTTENPVMDESTTVEEENREDAKEEAVEEGTI